MWMNTAGRNSSIGPSTRAAWAPAFLDTHSAAVQPVSDHKPSAPGLELLVLGYGNTLRGDDGVGPQVAEAAAELRLPGLEALACPQLTPELAEPVSRARRVLFVDAALDSPREVQLRELAPADSSQVIAHAADPRTILALSRDVFGKFPQAWWLTIPIQRMDIGGQLSPLAKAGCSTAIKIIKEFAQDEAAPSKF
jgi:hydrogenase maturation protease